MSHDHICESPTRNRVTNLTEFVVEVHVPSTQVAAQQGGMGGEYGGHGQLPMPAQHQSQAG